MIFSPVLVAVKLRFRLTKLLRVFSGMKLRNFCFYFEVFCRVLQFSLLATVGGSIEFDASKRSIKFRVRSSFAFDGLARSIPGACRDNSALNLKVFARLITANVVLLV